MDNNIVSSGTGFNSHNSYFVRTHAITALTKLGTRNQPSDFGNIGIYNYDIVKYCSCL